MTEFYIDRNDLPDIASRARKALSRANDLMAMEVQGNIMQFAPSPGKHGHGNLRTRWDIKKRGDLITVVSTNVEYALVQNDGSDPYEIYPRTAKALRFEIGGEVIYAKSVSHPGIAGTHYIEAGISKAEERTDEFVELGLQGENLI